MLPKRLATYMLDIDIADVQAKKMEIASYLKYHPLHVVDSTLKGLDGILYDFVNLD
jgi:hypothetical protein